MELPSNMVDTLLKFGVGKRTPHDDFFKSNETLSEMHMRLSVFDIDVGKIGDGYESFKCHVPGCSTEFDSLMEFESHYNSVHKFTCCECKKNLPSAHLLDLHVAEAHDSFFAALSERQPAYLCYIETCKIKSSNPEERMQHCIKEHKFPPNFRFDHKIQKQKPRNTNSANRNNINQDVSMESDNTSMDVSSNKSPKKNYIKPTKITFHPTRPKSFHQNKTYTGPKFTDHKIKTNNQSVLEDDEMLQDLKENLPKTS